MEWLVFVHVAAAMIGLGPAYAFPLLLKKERSVAEAAKMSETVARLEVFPKIFGTLAVVSGLLLFWLGSYGTILSLWLGGTLILYVVIEVVVIGFLAPAAKKLSTVLSGLTQSGQTEMNEQSAGLLARVRLLHVVSCALTLVIFALMVFKPV